MCYAYFMVKRNITLSLPADLIRQAKIYAAEHDTTVNALVRELLQEKISPEEQARAAGKAFLEIVRNGVSSPVDPGSIRREEIYEERFKRWENLF
jgi:plasmid stability protein